MLLFSQKTRRKKHNLRGGHAKEFRLKNKRTKMTGGRIASHVV